MNWKIREFQLFEFDNLRVQHDPGRLSFSEIVEFDLFTHSLRSHWNVTEQNDQNKIIFLFLKISVYQRNIREFHFCRPQIFPGNLKERTKRILVVAHILFLIFLLLSFLCAPTLWMNGKAVGEGIYQSARSTQWRAVAACVLELIQ